MTAAWEALINDKLLKSIKLLQGATQSRFQEQGITIAELTSIGKSNTGLLREVRNALGEYSEEHRNNLAVVKATQAVVESMAEQQAEMGEQLSKLRDMVEAQTELLQGQRPSPMGGKGWGPTSQAVPVSLEEAIRNPGQPPIYYAANTAAPARPQSAAMQHMSDLLMQITEMLHSMRYN